MSGFGQFSRRPLSPYISSTFEDFQVERDLLVKKAFPHLDELCRLRASHCTPVDLRWDENQANAGTAFQFCLDYVTKSCPFFICLLGERYGSHRPKSLKTLPRSYDQLPPNAEWIDKNFLVAAAGGYEWVLQDNYQHCSITELEIVQATQLNEAEHAVFYFRQPDHVDLLHTHLPENERLEKLQGYAAESEYSNLKVRDLKSRIVKRGLPVRYFKTPEELVDLVIKDWTIILDRVCPTLDKYVHVESEYLTESVAYETFAETRRKEFIRSYEVEEICNQITEFGEECALFQNIDEEYVGERELFKPHERRRKKESEQPVDPAILVLLGDRGSGKTAILSNWVKDFAEDHLDIQVMTHYVGASSLSVDVGVLMRNVIVRMRGHNDTGLDTDICDITDASKFYDLSESFRAALGMGPCVLMVDGIDGVSGAYDYSPQQIKELKWLPQPLPPGCRVVLSTVRSDLTFSVLQQRKDTKLVYIPSLTDSDTRVDLLEEHLPVIDDRLTSEQLEQISACKLSEKPLFLSILSSELKVFEVYSKLDHYLDLYLECSSIRDLWCKIIHRWINDYGWNVYNPLGEDENAAKGYTGWVADTLRLIAVSRNGLSKKQLMSVLQQMGYHGDREIKSFHWTQFWSSAQEALYENASGYICFLHQHLKETVEYKLLGAVTPDQGLMRDPRARCSMTPSLKVTALMSPFLGTSFPETPRSDPSRKTFHQHLADFFVKCPLGKQRSDELPWQLEMCNNMEELSEVLTEPQLFLDAYGDKWRHEYHHLDLIHYWRALSVAGYGPSENYDEMVESLSRGRPLIPRIVINEEEYEAPDEDEERVTDLEDDSCSTIEAFPDLYADLPSELTEHQKARLCRSVGMFLSELGHFNEAELMLHVAQEKLYENYPLGDDAQIMLSATEEALGNLYKHKGEIQKATKWYKKALRSLETLIEGLLDGEITSIHLGAKGRILDCLGYIAATDGEHVNAEKLLKDAEKCVLQLGNDAAKATIQYHLGVLRVNRGQFVEAEMLLRQAISTRERWCGKSHLLVAQGLNELAGVLGHPENNISFERYEAEALYRRALEIREECLGSDSLEVAATLFELGKLLKSEHITAPRSECIQLLRRALDIRTTKLGADESSTVLVRRALSSLEGTIKPKSKQQQHTSPARVANQIYSKMTWHDAELLMFETRAKAKSAEAARMKSMSRMAQDRNESRLLNTSTITPSAPRMSVMERRGSFGFGGGGDGGGFSPKFGSEASFFDNEFDDREGEEGEEEEEEEEAEEKIENQNDQNNDEGADVGVAEETVEVQGDSVIEGKPNAEDTPEEVVGKVPEKDGELTDTNTNVGATRGGSDNTEENPPILMPAPPTEAKKERPRSSYGQRFLNMNSSVQFIENHPGLKSMPPPISSPKSITTTTTGYMGHLSPSLPSLNNTSRDQKPMQAKLVLRISRPRTDPNKLYRRYGNSSGSRSESTVSPQPQRTFNEVVDESITMLDSNKHPHSDIVGKRGRAASCATSAPSGIYHIHRSTCHIPGPHTNDIHNSYSLTSGPNSTLHSLLGRPAVPRDVFLHIHHPSAWYHVPGRYPTSESPYPRKRSQKRLMYSSRSELRELGPSSYMEESSGLERCDGDDNTSHNSWDSGRNRIQIGTIGGNNVNIADWVI